MTKHFNDLTPAEAERLALLAEECGEVIQVIGKILRHGYDSYNPHDPDAGNNRMLLEKEIGDLSATIDIMRWERDVRDKGIHDAADRKLKRISQWLHHQTHPALKARTGDQP
jgi:NTP pyrophosphatase (non-canonical NTP hydrolase)